MTNVYQYAYSFTKSVIFDLELMKRLFKKKGFLFVPEGVLLIKEVFKNFKLMAWLI